MRPRRFVDGMKGMMLAALLVGLAGAVEVVLRDALVLDTIINDLAALARDRAPVMVAEALVGIEIILDVLIPSTSAKAAISMPILWPIAQLTGVSGQTTVLAYLVGNGLTNMVTPTSGMLLAYLGTGRVPYGTWMRFILSKGSPDNGSDPQDLRQGSRARHAHRPAARPARRTGVDGARHVDRRFRRRLHRR